MHKTTNTQSISLDFTPSPQKRTEEMYNNFAAIGKNQADPFLVVLKFFSALKKLFM